MNLKKLTAAAGALAIAAAPMALAKGKPEDPGSQGKSHGSQGQAHKPAKMKNVVLKGKFVSTDGTSIVVDVPKSKGKGNKKPSGQITVDVSKAKFNVADVNGDGKADVNDLAAGDKLVVQTRTDGTVFNARRVVDQTHPPVSQGDTPDDQAPATQPAVQQPTP